MEIRDIIAIGIFLIGLVGQSMYIRGALYTSIQNNKEDIRELQNTVRFEDTCEAIHDGLATRISSLEATRNGK